MNDPRSVVFLNRFYWPDVAATGQILADLAEDLAAGGWSVTVVASGGRYAGEGGLPAEEVHRGVRVVRVPGTRLGGEGLVGRAADYLVYLLGAMLRLLTLPRPTVVVAMSDPPLLFVPALLVARLRSARFVYWIQDLFPQIAARLGVLRETGAGYRLLGWLVRRLHARCDAVVTLGPAMAARAIAVGTPAPSTTVIHNWADAAAVRPVPRAANPFLREHGLEGKFVVLYSGNAGRAHTFGSVLEAARRLRDDPAVVFLFIGGGKQRAALEAAAAREGLANLRFMGYVPREQLANSLSAADVALVTENPAVAGLLVPSKTYGIMASGRPLVFVGAPDSDVARVVADADCGVVVPPDDADALLEAIRRLRHDPATAAAMGARGRAAAERHYSLTAAASRWASLLHAVTAGAPLATHDRWALDIAAASR